MQEIPSPTAETAPVVIVGGSLVGLSAAVFLSWRKVPVVLVERHEGSSLHPRAIGYTTRTLELFRAVGVDVPESDHGKGPPRRARVESLAGRWFGEYPWTAPTGKKPEVDLSPSHATAIAQDRLEPILRRRARELGADLRLGTELLGFTQDDAGVVARLRRRKDGHEYAIRADYLLAADGATSPVREALGIARSGEGLLSVQHSILFKAPLDEYLRHGVVQFEIEQPGFNGFLTTYSDGRWVLMLADDVERDVAEQRRVVQKALGRQDVPIELVTEGRWELAALIANRFSAGRVFLAGDAAHQLPPNRGGFGANTGIDDAHNLAWKLAAVLSGESTPALLETYDPERRAIAELRHAQIFARADYKTYLKTPKSDVAVLDDDAIELGQLYRSAAVLGAGEDLPPAKRPDEWAGQPGTRAPHLWLTVGDERRSTLDLFQRTWVLLTENERWADAVAGAVERLGVPVSFEHVGGSAKVANPDAFRAAYGLDATGAMLVRPDGYIAWRAACAPVDLEATLVEALGRVAFPAANQRSARNSSEAIVLGP